MDLFSCAGGAGYGYHLAGFEVVGVDIKPQPNYPFEHHVGDAIEFLKQHSDEFDAVHASPPCQASCTITKQRRAMGKADQHIDLIPETRDALDAAGKPYVIENVQGSALRRDLVLCGEMFGLSVIRHRYFELGGWTAEAPAHVKHRGGVSGYRSASRGGGWVDGPYYAVYGNGGGKGSVHAWQDAMGIHWTDVRKELSEAIPPAYTEFIGKQLRRVTAPAVAGSRGCDG